MHLSNWFGFLGSIAAVMVTGWVFRKVKTTVPPTAGDVRTLRYHRAYAIVGWVGVLLCVSLAMGVILSEDMPLVLWIDLPACGLFALLSFVPVVMYQRYMLVYDADSIRYSPLWGQGFGFTWSDIEAVRFSGMAQWWRLHLRDGRNVRVGTYMHGALEFIQTVAARTHLRLPTARLPDGRAVTYGSAKVG